MKSNFLLLCRYRITYIALFLVMSILVLESFWYVGFLLPYTFYFTKKHKDLILITLLVIIVYMSSRHLYLSKSIKESAQYEVLVTKVFNDSDYTQFEGIIDNQMVKLYLSSRETMVPGDVYQVSGDLVEPINTTVPGMFSYKGYLASKKIKYQLFVNDYQYIKHVFHIGVLRYKVEQYIDNSIVLSSSYIKTFVLADRSEFDHNLINNINTLGISHLFAVSGLHIGLLVLSLRKLFKSIKISSYVGDTVISCVLILYMVLTSFSPSVVRASMMFIVLVINNKFQIKFSPLDLLSIVFLLSLFFSPFYYKNPGFVLSFLVTTFLMLTSSILRQYKGIELLFMVSYISFLSTLPIILNMNYSINLLSLLFNIIFISYMTYVILPLSYITFLLPFLDNILYLFVQPYNKFINIFSSIKIFIVHGAFTHKVEVMIYYILIIIYMAIFQSKKVRKKVFICLIIFVILTIYIPIFDVQKSVTFLDVKGDATFISDGFDRCNILIDTGEQDDYDSVIHYIQSKNKRRLDYLIVSHFHSDHYGEVDDITETFAVKNTITPNNVSLYHNQRIICGSLSFYIYDLSIDNINENNNSLMMSLFIADKHYLFTGDAETRREYEFINKFTTDVDYLKVPHHGSMTSSSELFIDSVSPEEAIIMVHRDNQFHHPDETVTQRYQDKNITLYRTDIMGTIEVTYNFGFERKKYNKP